MGTDPGWAVHQPAHNVGARAEPSEVRMARAPPGPRPPPQGHREGETGEPTAMMTDLLQPVFSSSATVAVLAFAGLGVAGAVYLWSPDPDRRTRALRLLRLLLRK